MCKKKEKKNSAILLALLHAVYQKWTNPSQQWIGLFAFDWLISERLSDRQNGLDPDLTAVKFDLNLYFFFKMEPSVRDSTTLR